MLDIIGRSTGLAYGSLVDDKSKHELLRVDEGNEIKCENVGHCAMGELLYAAGLPNKKLATMGGTPPSWPIEVKQLLFDTYQIDDNDSSGIISANDSVQQFSYDEAERQRVLDARERAVMDRIRLMGSDGRKRARPVPFRSW